MAETLPSIVDDSLLCMIFLDKLSARIDDYVCKSMATRDSGYLEYQDMQGLTLKICNLFRQSLGYVPQEISEVCQKSSRMMEAGVAYRRKMIRNVFALLIGLVGVYLIISGFSKYDGTELSWWEKLWNAPRGKSVTEITAYILGGVGMDVLAGMIYQKSSDKHQQSINAVRALKQGLANAVHALWTQGDNAQKLSQI